MVCVTITPISSLSSLLNSVDDGVEKILVLEGADVVVQPDEGRLEALPGGHVHAAQAHPEGIHQRQQHEAQEADDEGQNEQIAGYCSARTNGNAFAAHLLTSCCAA